jgi:chromosome segregation ATPase
MGHQFRITPEAEKWAAWLAGRVRSAWRGRPGSEARRIVGKVGFWVATPGLEAAFQRQLVALQRTRREVADVASACKRLDLQISELEQRASGPQDSGLADGAAEQLAELRRQHADLWIRQERLSAVSTRLIAEINEFRAGKEAAMAAYKAAEEAAKTVSHK